MNTSADLNNNSTLCDIRPSFKIREDYEKVRNWAMVPVLAVFGCIGNMLVVTTFSSRFNSHNCNEKYLSLRVLVTSLMVSDSGILIFSAANSLISLLGSENLLQLALYNLTLLNIVGNTSVLISTLIVVDRFFAVAKPFKHRHLFRRQTLTVMMTMLVVIGILASLPKFWDTEPRIYLVNGEKRLYMLPTEIRENQIYVIYWLVLNGVVFCIFPCFTVLVLNVKICQCLNLAKNNRNGLLQASTRVKCNCPIHKPTPSPVPRHCKQQKHYSAVSIEVRCCGTVSKSEHSTNWMLVLEGFVFLICNTLYTVYLYFEYYAVNKCEFAMAMMWVANVVDVTFLLNAASNFMIFYVFGTQFRQQISLLGMKTNEQFQKFRGTIKKPAAEIDSSDYTNPCHDAGYLEGDPVEGVSL